MCSKIRKIAVLQDGEWIEYANDDDWSTRLYWERTNVILGESEVYIYNKWY